jgi:Lon protease-like protein
MPGQDPSFSDIQELPIFPLPNVVLFPRTVLPLHIFEPRYKQMVADALEGSRQIGMVLLQPGWESKQNESPEIFDTGGMGLITQYKDLEEGRYNILLSGRHRYRIVEFIREKPYRVARVRLLQEVMPDKQEMNEISTELILGFRELTEANTQLGLEPDVIEKLDFPTLVNSICSSLNLSIYDQQQLLEMNSVKVRATTVLGILRRQIARKRMVSKFRYLQPEDPHVN